MPKAAVREKPIIVEQSLMAANILNSPRAVAMSVYVKDAVPYRVKRRTW